MALFDIHPDALAVVAVIASAAWLAGVAGRGGSIVGALSSFLFPVCAADHAVAAELPFISYSKDDTWLAPESENRGGRILRYERKS